MPITRHPLFSGDERGFDDIPLDDALIERLESGYAALSPRLADVTVRFYERLFKANPELRAMFPADMTNQRKKLADTLDMIARHLRRPEGIMKQLEDLGVLHLQKGVRAEQYPLVREALVAAMGDVAGENWSPELASEWLVAIDQVGQIMRNGAAKASK
jgi:nitric oxide dioxygenase